jgi:hypothetical protein
MKFISLKYSNKDTPAGTASGPVTGRLIDVTHGEIVEVPEQDVAAFLSSENWSMSEGKETEVTHRDPIKPTPKKSGGEKLTTR